MDAYVYTWYHDRRMNDCFNQTSSVSCNLECRAANQTPLCSAMQSTETWNWDSLNRLDVVFIILWRACQLEARRLIDMLYRKFYKNVNVSTLLQLYLIHLASPKVLLSSLKYLSGQGHRVTRENTNIRFKGLPEKLVLRLWWSTANIHSLSLVWNYAWTNWRPWCAHWPSDLSLQQ